MALTNRARALEGGDGRPVLRPKDGYGSRLIAFVTASGSRRMPPDEPPLTADQIALLKQWIDQGDDWPPATDVPDRRARATTEHWSFRPLRAVTVPEVRHSHWPRSPIDHFLLARWESRGVAPGPQADRATLLRRASFDLLGLPPTPDLHRPTN